MRIKVCGMREPDNISSVTGLGVDYIGFIFYDKSPRFVGSTLVANGMIQSGDTKTVGVFVNEEVDRVLEIANTYSLDAIQLHGSESVDVCRAVREAGFTVIKAIPVKDELPVESLATFTDAVDYFLFDTKTPAHGGSGKSFDWSALDQYDLDVPFFLSGGLSPDNQQQLLSFEHPMLYAIDLNSKFEKSPGLKDVDLLRQYIKNINHAISR